MMRTITFTCELLTPLFMYGADQSTPELRPSGIKGALHFWWRAIQTEQDWRVLREKEASIFGSADEKFGRSKVVISISKTLTKYAQGLPHVGFRTSMYGGTKKGNKDVDLLKFLAYGKEKQQYFEPSATAIFSFALSTPTEFYEEILTCILLMGAFGGLGAKARNGFGRFRIIRIYESIGATTKELPIPDVKEIVKHLKQAGGELKNWTSFSKHSKCYNVVTENINTSWESILGTIGRVYKKAKESLDQPHRYNYRKYIALPIGNLQKDRHSKVIFFGVLPGYHPQLLYLPYLYQPSEKIKNNHQIDVEFQAAHQKFFNSINLDIKELP